jgi:hypothetical protein
MGHKIPKHQPSKICMKKNHFLAAFLITLSLLAHGQNTDDDTAFLLPVPQETAPAAPEAPTLEVTNAEILQTRTVLRPDQIITIQELTPQEITPLPEPPPPQAASAENPNRPVPSISHRMSMLSCTVHRDDATSATRTHLKWTSQGKTPVEFYEAWSNIDFRDLSQVTTFEKKKVRHNVMFGINIESSAKSAELARRFGRTYTPPSIPALPANAASKPTFILTLGAPNADDLAVVEGLHELYKKHYKNFIAENKRIAKVNAREAAKLKANPPDPTPDVLIRYWIPETPISPTIATEPDSANQNTEGGAP